MIVIVVRPLSVPTEPLPPTAYALGAGHKDAPQRMVGELASEATEGVFLNKYETSLFFKICYFLSNSL